MEARTVPSFTTAIRGYDREEVDEYVDSLAKALEDLEESEEQNRRLQGHLSRLNARIHELEDRIRTETPHTAGALGERITLLLTEAEDGATRAIDEAEAEAAAIVERAEASARTIEEEAAAIVERAEASARNIEAEARSQAALLVADADRRATARTRQVEEWEQQVVAHTHAQQAYQARLHQDAEDAHQARLADLSVKREAAVSALSDVRETLDKLLERVATEGDVPLQRDVDEMGPPASPDDIDADLPLDSEPAEAEESAAVSAGPAAFDQEADGSERAHPHEAGSSSMGSFEPITETFRIT